MPQCQVYETAMVPIEERPYFIHAFLTKRIGLRHKCSLKFANLVLTEMKNHMETPKLLELLPSIVLDAASRGISEIVKLCFEHFPELTWNQNFIKELMKNVVKGRHVEFFRLLNAPGTIPLLTDDVRRHLRKEVVEWSQTCLPKDVSGAHFLMQRELQWFKVLEDMSDPSSKSLPIKNILSAIKYISKSPDLSEDETSDWDEFVEKRTELLKEAGQWMKDTSSSYSLVSTLIITVTFAAAFTVPGGNDSPTGILKFLKESSVMVFAIADAFALFSSVAATLMFLAILTSRYGAEDFLNSLPTKMILGLTFLFLSLAFMLVAFGSALTIVLREQLKWIYIPIIPITFFAAIPIVLFAILHLPLYFEMIESTYWPSLYRPLKLWE
ncbi:hypothetical protein ACJRO7_015828 [Eucalyptus globulus]|uniref:PGG domain-containing protein n=1 Tax=Eucalyptus globulus TaxID=34317 RepID=A0ABD3L5T6_EUCGL